MTALTRRRLLGGAAAAAAATALTPFAVSAMPRRCAARRQAGAELLSHQGRRFRSDHRTATACASLRRRPTTCATCRNEQVLAAAEAAYMPKGNLVAPFNPLVVNTGSKLVLMDTGFGPGVGRRSACCRPSWRPAASIPKAIDIVLISHMHGDHILGLKNADGSLAFPNAEIKVPANRLGVLDERRQRGEVPGRLQQGADGVQPQDLLPTSRTR